jgi:hypothetical protein
MWRREAGLSRCKALPFRPKLFLAKSTCARASEDRGPWRSCWGRGRPSHHSLWVKLSWSSLPFTFPLRSLCPQPTRSVDVICRCRPWLLEAVWSPLEGIPVATRVPIWWYWLGPLVLGCSRTKRKACPPPCRFGVGSPLCAVALLIEGDLGIW